MSQKNNDNEFVAIVGEDKRRPDSDIPPPPQVQDHSRPVHRSVPITVFFGVQMLLGALVFGALTAIFIESQRVATDTTVKELVQRNMVADRLKLWEPLTKLVNTARLATKLVNDTNRDTSIWTKKANLSPSEYVPLLQISRDVVTMDALFLYSSFYVQNDVYVDPLLPNENLTIWDGYGGTRTCQGQLRNHSFLTACGQLENNLTVDRYEALESTDAGDYWPLSPVLKDLINVRQNGPHSRGKWFGIAVTEDPSVQELVMVLGFLIPLRFDPVTSFATHYVSIELNASYFSSIMGDLATTSSSTTSFYNLHDHRMIAWNLPINAVNVTSLAMYRLGQTPSELVNKAALRTLKEYPNDCVNVLEYVDEVDGGSFTTAPPMADGGSVQTARCSDTNEQNGQFSHAFVDSSFVEVSHNSEQYIVASTRLFDVYGFNGLLVETVPKDHYYGELQRSRTFGIVVAVGASVIGSLITLVHLHIILKPLKKLKADLVTAGRLAFSSHGTPEELSSYITEIHDVATAGSKLVLVLFNLKRFIPDTLLRPQHHPSMPDVDVGRRGVVSQATNPLDSDASANWASALHSASANTNNTSAISVSMTSNSAGATRGSDDEPSCAAEQQLLSDLVLLPEQMLQVQKNLPEPPHANTNTTLGGDEEPRHSPNVEMLPLLHQQQLTSRKVTLVYAAVTHINTSDPSTTVDTTSSFLSAVTGRFIHSSGGVIEELRPDSVLISFNAHHSVVNHEQSGLRCALRIAEKLDKFSGSSSIGTGEGGGQHSPPTMRDVHIAVDTSPLFVGLFNGYGRSFRSVVGDGVATVRKLAQMCNLKPRNASDHAVDLLVGADVDPSNDGDHLELKCRQQSSSLTPATSCSSLYSTDVLVSERTKRSVVSSHMASNRHQLPKLVLVDRVNMDPTNQPNDPMDSVTSAATIAEEHMCFIYAPVKRLAHGSFLQSKAGADSCKAVLLALCRGDTSEADKAGKELAHHYCASVITCNGNPRDGAPRYTIVRDAAVKRLLLLVEHYRVQASFGASAFSYYLQYCGPCWFPLPAPMSEFTTIASGTRRLWKVRIDDVPLHLVEAHSNIDSCCDHSELRETQSASQPNNPTSSNTSEDEPSVIVTAIDKAIGVPSMGSDGRSPTGSRGEEAHDDSSGFLSFAPVNTGNGNGDHGAVGPEDVVDLPLLLVDQEGNRWLRSPEPFASGGFSEVYQGIGDNATLIAIKVMQLSLSHKAPDIDLLKSELTISSRLRHQNITPYLSWQVVGRQFVCIFMEWLPGGALAQLMSTFFKPLAQIKDKDATTTSSSIGDGRCEIIKRIVTECLHGLQYLHSEGVVHSDIKPHNLLLGTDGTVKLADFGSALSTTHTVNEMSSVSDVFVMRGTSWYMAPEVAAGETPTTASDMWSFGITILELLVGELPWSLEQRHGIPGSGGQDVPPLVGGAGAESKFMRQLGCRDPTFRPKIPFDPLSNPQDGPLHDLLVRCLHVNPLCRPSAAELLQSDFVVSTSN